MLYNSRLFDKNLEETKKSVPLYCVFHSIRFKVNKGWDSAESLFLCPYHDIKFFSYANSHDK